MTTRRGMERKWIKVENEHIYDKHKQRVKEKEKILMRYSGKTISADK